MARKRMMKNTVSQDPAFTELRASYGKTNPSQYIKCLEKGSLGFQGNQQQKCLSLWEGCVFAGKTSERHRVPSIKWKARDTNENKQSQTYVGVDPKLGCTQETTWRALQSLNALLKCHFYQNPWGWGPNISVFQQFRRWLYDAAKVSIYRYTDSGKEGFLNKVLLLNTLDTNFSLQNAVIILLNFQILGHLGDSVG